VGAPRGAHAGKRTEGTSARLPFELQNDTSPGANRGRESSSSPPTTTAADGSRHRTPRPSVPVRVLLARLRYRGAAMQRAHQPRIEAKER
jgi:hypothetical protein